MAATTFSKAWAFLDKRERLNAVRILVLMFLGAFASAAMVGSVFPFLTVLADPSLIERNGLLRWLYDVGGFELFEIKL